MSAPAQHDASPLDARRVARAGRDASATAAGTAAGVAILLGLAGLVATVRVSYAVGKVAGWCAAPGWPL